MEVEMAVPKAQNRLGNTYSKCPKTTVPTGLSEKLWERLIPRRTTPVWDKHNALNEAQHCRFGRGCSAALLHFQAALETAQESGTDIFMSSWDIQRSYDSPSKPDIRLAWMRLGIPPYIAGYLLAIDSEGETLMKTPAAYTAWTKKLRKEMPPTTVDNDLPQPFKAETGVSQRAALSPTTWLAFFNILLVALSS